MKKKPTVKKLILLGIIIFFIGIYINQFLTMKKIKQQIVDSKNQLEEIQEKNERLQEEVDKINKDSPEYLEKLARERLGMIKPGEKIVNNDDEKEQNW